jgi:photosystem II stability/assembly factor-like uncharacterized protein
LVFEDQEPEAFYDGIVFFDRDHRIALSDPVGGKFRILTTGDGGRSWKVASSNGMSEALPAEGVHATGTSLVKLDKTVCRNPATTTASRHTV